MSDGIKRRDFLKVLGVSGAGAGMVGCSTENVEKLIPYVVPPEDITPGVATWYTSVCQECPAQCGIWVRTREGRAVKVEGNPNHPVSRGASCARGQSSLQGLYNPDRFPGPMVREGGELRQIGWDDAEQRLAEALGEAEGELLFITGKSGPAMGALADDFVSALGGSRVEHEGLSLAPLREAARLAFGADVVPRYDFSAARFVVSFGADFLETWMSPVEHARGFARASANDIGAGKAPFVYVGPRLSLTGQNADEWVPIQAGSEAAVALGMASVIADGDVTAAGPYAQLLGEYDAVTAASVAGVEESDIRELAQRFVENGPSLAVGTGVADHHRNATASNLAILILNQVTGNVGRTIHLQGMPSAASAPYAELESSIRAMAGGRVGVALVHGTNPAYTLPPSSGFAEAFAAVPLKVSFASAPDETTAMADLVLPDLHFLESWGDSNPAPGVYAIQQPTMQGVPHFESKHTGDVLLAVAGRMGEDLGASTFYDYLQERWSRLRDSGATAPSADQTGTDALAGADADDVGQESLQSPVAGFDGWWRQALRKGVVELSGEAGGEATSATLRSPDVALSFDAPTLDGEEMMEHALIVYPSSRFGDGGRVTNRPWLLELPDPVSKIAWSSWVEIHPESADRMGVENGDVVTVSTPHGSVTLPVWRYPGIREDAVAIAMGLGHENAGRWADGNGVNPMQLLPAVAEQPSGALVTLATRCSVEPTGVRQKLATIEGSDDQHGRPIAMAVGMDALASGGRGVEEHTADPEPETAEVHDELAEQEPVGADYDDHGEEGGHGPLRELQLGGGFVPVETEGAPEDFPLPGAQYGDYADPENTPRWAMAIDLDKCTGCSACVTACQAENNVPYVGEEQVVMGRDMHWIRLERYYETVDASHAGPVDVRHLPMLCQHCGNAPCEPVCPVFAAYHTPDGLNGQVYNRCVGTRYCANNCPYKVRVFNWYTVTGEDQYPEPMNWQFNPDVTVRENGVMEKCSFCVQRIREAQNRAALEGARPIRDGEVVPACEQSCPAEAIVFGNIRDETSRVARAVHDSPRTYRVLDELINTQPAVNYMKKVTTHAVVTGDH